MPPKKNKDIEDSDSNCSEAGYRVRISFSDLEKSMTPFTGDDTYPITNWLTDFNDTANLMEWNNLEKLIYAKRLLSGTAKLFLRSLGSITSWDTLKESLLEEFGPKLNSASIHKKLASRKMKPDETYQQYFLHMKELALHGNLEDEALIEYVIDGIRDSEINKAILYGATDIKQFRKKLEVYAQIKEHKMQQRPIQMTTGRKNHTIKRCYNCGETDHQSPACTKGIKCFKCNGYGHKSKECQNEKVSTDVVKPYKEAKINGVTVKTFIDTGSDANLICESYYKQNFLENNDYNIKDTLKLSGIAEYEVCTKGSFMAKVEIDNVHFETLMHVIDDDVIPVNVILGNPILKDVEIIFSADGISVKRILHLTQINDYEEEFDEKYDIKKLKYKDKIKHLLDNYNNLKTRKKESNVKLKIILTDEDPIHQTPRRLSPLEKDIVNKQIQKWLDQEVIKPSKSEYASPIVLAKKKNGSYRLCIDFRKLNKKIIKERYPLPLIEDQRTQAIQYEIGDLVAIKRTQFVQGYKLNPKYLGPYKIIKKKKNDRYVVRKISNGEGPMNTTSSADLMKPWSTGDEDEVSHSSGSDE
ncbi:hypothetical protein K1T71_005360 [Dendrolimus kikuchii]|uniref:Uncharacterized protein n=1 Tax=Dendrolimus kikuchii TaxID=765133 RepID=A0ACC1D438_9NEOP|nr:hypothetical protein K1T71_005360 [Dendrolimus kikuchii]